MKEEHKHTKDNVKNSAGEKPVSNDVTTAVEQTEPAEQPATAQESAPTPPTPPTPVAPVAPVPVPGPVPPQPQAGPAVPPPQMAPNYAYGYYGQPGMMPQPNPESEFKGLKGWLAFMMVVMFLNGISCLFLFVTCLSSIVGGRVYVDDAVGVILLPIQGIVMLVAAIFIGMRKRVAKSVAQWAVVTAAAVSTIVSIVDLATQLNSRSSLYYLVSANTSSIIVMSVGLMILQIVVYAVIIIYLQKSRRVKATLVEP